MDSISGADILEKVIKASVRKLEIKYSNLLGVAQTIIGTIINGFVRMFALAFGLAFGLGGKNAAAEAIKNLKDKLSEK
ncbi:MAG: hypothetical protein WA093_05075 [Minisyncoccales bacterium]